MRTVCFQFASRSRFEFQIGFTQLANNLLHLVTFLRHSERPFRARSPENVHSLTQIGGRLGLGSVASVFKNSCGSRVERVRSFLVSLLSMTNE